MKLFPVKRSPRVGETGISSRVPSCKRDGTPCVSGEGERRRIHIYIRMEKNLIPRQYKLLIMRPAFTCLLIGPPCLLGKIERSHDRPSLTPNAPRARHGPVLAAPFLSLSFSLISRAMSFAPARIWTCRKSQHASLDQFPASSLLTIEIWIRRPSLR